MTKLSSIKNYFIKNENKVKIKEEIKSEIKINLETPFLCNDELIEKNFTKSVAKNYCNECRKQFRSRSKLDAHFRMHSRIENRKSLNLEDKTSNIEKLVGNDLKAKKIFACKFCAKKLTSKTNLESHHQGHIKKQKFPCTECSESFEHFVNLARHISIVHKKHDPSRIECPFCEKMVSSINAHLRTHQDKPMNCDLCDATLKNYSAYKSHKRFHVILLQRGEDRAITPKNIKKLKTKVDKQCVMCEKVFCSDKLWLLHLKTHIRIPLFPCPYCDEDSCISFEQLLLHVSNVHRRIPEGYVQCQYCVNIVSDIESHMKSHRTALIDCEMCENHFFTRESSYWKHFNKKHKKCAENRVIFIGRCFNVQDVPENAFIKITLTCGQINSMLEDCFISKKCTVSFVALGCYHHT